MLTMHGRLLFVGAMCALTAALFMAISAEQADAQGTAAATAVSASCGQAAAFSHRNSVVHHLSSANSSKMKTLCLRAWVSFSKVNFIRHHRVLIAPRFKFWWNVPDRKWRRLVRRSRAILRRNQTRFIRLSHRIIALQEQSIINFDGYVPPSEARRIGALMAAKRGWTTSNGQWQCLDELWGTKNGRTLESGWNMRADNPRSDAYGIPQALPGSKMGKRWMTSVWVQIKWGLGYIKQRFGSPCGALSVRLAKGWY